MVYQYLKNFYELFSGQALCIFFAGKKTTRQIKIGAPRARLAKILSLLHENAAHVIHRNICWYPLRMAGINPKPVYASALPETQIERIEFVAYCMAQYTQSINLHLSLLDHTPPARDLRAQERIRLGGRVTQRVGARLDQ